ncbi:MAG TPA: TIGR02679 domain-containing protein [Amycolatopsis sp.]|uniref:TIGR02679 domain-containing protein n=1 Tax=Amycolatopsis sp. TaxID=37632 RepID=UPI002B4778F9|nr:TIGR02679 domain-containing protein [Amycolatopsis sp.]HKS44296.1 TIGR02679 domain-containing protein [Amycolatopsis sp.]
MTPAELPANARALANDADLAPLWQAVHQRLCQVDEPAELATVSVTGLSAGGVALLRSWLDTSTRRRRGKSAISLNGGVAKVPLRELLAEFGVAAEDLSAIAELATGEPVVNRTAGRAASAAARATLWTEVESTLAAVPLLARRIRAAGVADTDIDLVRTESRYLAAAVAKIDRLRLQDTPPMTLAKLAHDCTGDPHGFDLDELIGRRLVEAVAERAGEPITYRPDAVRALLARSGVLADRLSSSVVVLNLRASGTSVVDERLRLGGGPVPLTLFDLTVNPPTLADAAILVVENPSVIEAALAVGFTCPIACTSGHLRAVDHAFLQHAIDCGVSLNYAGDVDRDGLIIAAQVRELYGARVLAMDHVTVTKASAAPSSVPLRKLPDETSPELVAALADRSRAVYQENDVILNVLLGGSPVVDTGDDPSRARSAPFPSKTTRKPHPGVLD